MSVTIYHNPACGTSRNTLALLHSPDLWNWEVRCVLLHPRMFLSTRQARGILTRLVDLSDVVWQTANLAGFLAGQIANGKTVIDPTKP